MNELPFYVWLLVFTGAAGIPLAASVALGRYRPAAWALAGLAGAWLAADWLLADAGAYKTIGTSNFSPGLVAALLAFLAVLLAAARHPAVTRALSGPDAVARLTLPHTLRVVGVVFLFVLALGTLPAIFALPAGLGDIAVGLAAPFVVRQLRRGEGDAARRRAVTFHLLGIADLVIAVSLGVLAGLLGITPSLDAVTVMPLVLIPTLAVPAAVALHLTALRKLTAGRPEPHPRTETPVGADARSDDTAMALHQR